MTQHAEAIFEDGLLRPLEPLSLQNKQHVLLIITDVSAPGANSGRMPEQEWLRAHGQEYSGQWSPFMAKSSSAMVQTLAECARRPVRNVSKLR